MDSHFDLSAFASRVEELMEERGITSRSQLALNMGYSKQTVSNYLNVTRERLPASFIYDLAKKYHLSADYLLGLSLAKSRDAVPAVDALGLPDSVIEKLLEVKESDILRYAMLSLLILSPWFWDTISLMTEIIKRKASGYFEGEGSFRISSDESNGTKGIEYRGEYAWDVILQDVSRRYGNGMRTLAEVMCDCAGDVIDADAARRMLEKQARERGDH